MIVAVTSAPQLPSSEEYSGCEYGGLSVERRTSPYSLSCCSADYFTARVNRRKLDQPVCSSQGPRARKWRRRRSTQTSTHRPRRTAQPAVHRRKVMVRLLESANLQDLDLLDASGNRGPTSKMPENSTDVDTADPIKVAIFSNMFRRSAFRNCLHWR